MDATCPPIEPPHLLPGLVTLGDTVLYHVADHPPRAAIVGHVYPNGRTVDLVVLLDGDPRVPEARAAWALGSSVYRVRTSIPCAEDDPAGARHWTHRPRR